MAVPQIFTTFDKDILLQILDGLVSGIQQLKTEKIAIENEIIRLKELNSKLQSDIEQLIRESSRQATPFSRGKRKKRKKRPGRKAGEGVFRHKDIPLASEITEPSVDVPVTETVCPDCG